MDRLFGAEAALALTLDDQAGFAKLSRRLLEDLDLAAAEDPDKQEPDDAGDDEECDEGGSDDSASTDFARPKSIT